MCWCTQLRLDYRGSTISQSPRARGLARPDVTVTSSVACARKNCGYGFVFRFLRSEGADCALRTTLLNRWVELHVSRASINRGPGQNKTVKPERFWTIGCVGCTTEIRAWTFGSYSWLSFSNRPLGRRFVSKCMTPHCSLQLINFACHRVEARCGFPNLYLIHQKLLPKTVYSKLDMPFMPCLVPPGCASSPAAERCWQGLALIACLVGQVHVSCQFIRALLQQHILCVRQVLCSHV